MKLALLFLTLSVMAGSADAPPDNNLPTIGIRINRNETPELSDVTLEHLAMLSWKYFDGVDAWAWPSDPATVDVVGFSDSLGMVLVLLPVEMGCFLNTADEVNGLWFRWPEYDLDQARAFAKVLVESGEPDWDSLSAFLDGPAFYDSLPENWMLTLNDNTDEHPAYWFFGLWDEGNTNQRANMVEASEDTTDNVVRVAFLVEPRDYSTEVLDDPWDMREATVSPPAWKTADIDTVYNWDASAWTDSIGGMFEGTIPSGHFDDNRLVLHIPASSLYWIDGDMYNRFSIVGKTTGTAADIVLGWVNSHNDVDSMEVGELSMTYGRTEVIDLADDWEGLTIKRLWLGFRYPEQPVLDRRVRIGRVWLEEATP